MLQSHLEVNGMPQVINLSELLKLTEQCRQASKNKNGISDKLVKIYSQAIDIIEDQLITEKFKKKKKVKQTSVT